LIWEFFEGIFFARKKINGSKTYFQILSR
jgi:hypothetical protein